MALDRINNYVKFIKGSTEAWAQLDVADRKSDTLYFITEYEKDASGYVVENGKKKPISTSLYLGNVLVSDGKDSTVLPGDLNLKLEDLEDVNLEGTLTDKMVLAYDAETEKWIPQSIDSISTGIEVFEGATDDKDGVSGLVPVPTKGSQLKVLTGNGNWTALADLAPVSDLVTTTNNHSQTLNTLIGTNQGKSIEEIASLKISEVVAGADKNFDTLKEISDWIINHPGDVSELNSRLLDLEAEVFNYEEYIDEETGETITLRTSKIETLEDSFSAVDTAIQTNTSAVDELKNLLGYEKKDEESTASLKAVEKIDIIAKQLGVTDDNINDEEIQLSIPAVGDLSKLYINLDRVEDGQEELDNLVDVINELTQQMTWGELSD